MDYPFAQFAADAPTERWPDIAPSRQLATVEVPVNIVVGANDLPCMLSDAALLHEQLPQGEMTVMEEAAHMANLDQPERFNRLVLDFLTNKSLRETT